MNRVNSIHNVYFRRIKFQKLRSSIMINLNSNHDSILLTNSSLETRIVNRLLNNIVFDSAKVVLFGKSQIAI